MSEHIDDTGDSEDDMVKEPSIGLSITCPQGFFNPAL